MNAANDQPARRSTRKVAVGPLVMGGGAPVSVQGMTKVFTRDIDACVAQINRMTAAGCEIVRVAAATAADTAALPEIIKQTKVPIVADVHFHYRRALEAIEAGVAKIRLNPGNIKDRRQVEEVIAACQAKGTAIRVGVNEGSVVDRQASAAEQRQQMQDLESLMVDKLTEYVSIFAQKNFEALVLSAKSHDVRLCIAVNRQISRRFDYPLHLGLTHSGDVETGTIRSAAALAPLLAEGIGDTMRISLAGDPVKEIEVAWELLSSLKLRERTRPELIVCPTCGRTEIDLLGITEKVKAALADIHIGISVAVMGCVVNGPGEAAGVDVALCGGRDRAVIYRSGRKAATVPADQAIEALMEQINSLVAERSIH